MSINIVRCILTCLGTALVSSPATSQSILQPGEQSAVYVEPVSLAETQSLSGLSLNVAAVVSDKDFADGLQKAADVYGIKLDLFLSQNIEYRREAAERFIAQDDSYLVVDQLDGENWRDIDKSKSVSEPSVKLWNGNASPDNAFTEGFNTLRAARDSIVMKIPKYEEILPIAFPISPLPDSFFQPSKFPYPSPLVRVARTHESLSASVHAHTSCNMVAQTGNMLHRTSSLDKNRLLMGMEGGNLSLHAQPGAIASDKISAVMTSWVLNVDRFGANREILVENNGLDSSVFSVGLHAPEELEIALENMQKKGDILSFQILDHELIKVVGSDGKPRTFRAGMFLVANDKSTKGPEIIVGNDKYGAMTLDFFSTQAFVQQLVEQVAASEKKTKHNETGGILTAGGTTVGNSIGRPLAEAIREVPQSSAPVTPYVFSLEGGFIIVTPETPLTKNILAAPISKIYLDLRGPLTSDQTITVHLSNSATEKVVFRRTIIDFDQFNDALAALQAMGMISGWEFEGSRGRGLFANVVLKNFLGKNRKFMSSLSSWPTDELPDKPLVRMYVDGMQRLNFGLLTREGWRQEFVEVPLRIPPVPRDISLYSGKSSLD
ncbi:MAG: hypothetical protein ABJO01_06695 [Parasphingorhabdus sp.]|uniref:hypothetical protein n=1 Tax=Parasphingorhabdus sp. TaxID=2709688 RepID=UPI003299805B